ncbi:MAG: type I 3-dehydroquinate dehydratase [Candidatus Diapherotrites archaeon]
MNIVLTGFMGSGKSTVGKLLSERLGMGFADTDRMAEKIAGKSLVRIFSEDGEKAFRETESRVALVVSAMDETVIATGGGFVLRPENMEAVEANSAVFCLDVSVDSVIERIGHCTDRPLLLSGNSREKIAKQLEDRSEAYKRADFTIPEMQGAEKSAEAILGKIRPAKICAVVRSMAEAEKASALGADFVELRIDLMESKDEIPGIISSCRVPVIATNRNSGLEELEAIECGCAFVDIDIGGKKMEIVQGKAKEAGCKIISSFHDFKETPSLEELEKILEAEMAAGDIGKIVTIGRSRADVEAIFSVLKKSREKGFPLIAFLMGEKWQNTRILSVLKGGFLAFASAGKPVAEGQMGLTELKRRLKK